MFSEMTLVSVGEVSTTLILRVWVPAKVLSSVPILIAPLTGLQLNQDLQRPSDNSRI